MVTGAAVEVVAGDGTLSVSNYSTQTASRACNPLGPFIRYEILLGDFVRAVTVQGLCLPSVTRKNTELNLKISAQFMCRVNLLHMLR